MEQLFDEVVVADLHQRHDGGVSERGVRIDAHCRERVGRNLVADERLHDLRGPLRVGHALRALRQRRPLHRHVQATVGGQSFEQRLREPELGGLPSGRDVPHVSYRSHEAAH